MKLKLIDITGTEPVSLADARKHLRIDDDIISDDDFIEALISAAREHAEKMTGRSFMLQTWEGALDCFPGDRIKLPNGPVRAIVSVTSIDPTGSETTLSGSLYVLNDYGLVPELCLKPGQSWPAIQSGAINPVKIRYEAGYGDSDPFPNVVKQWILLRVGQAYKEREAYAENGFSEMPFVDRLLDSVRVPVL